VFANHGVQVIQTNEMIGVRLAFLSIFENLRRHDQHRFMYFRVRKLNN
jgi:hypothetical protein